MPATAADAKGLLLSSIFDDDPVFPVEMLVDSFSDFTVSTTAVMHVRTHYIHLSRRF